MPGSSARPQLNRNELIDPKGIFLGLTRLNPMSQAVRYLLWGKGETDLMVYTILLRH
jgi:hypothetical protein